MASPRRASGTAWLMASAAAAIAGAQQSPMTASSSDSTQGSRARTAGNVVTASPSASAVTGMVWCFGFVLGAQRQPFERGPRQNDRVPISGGDPGHKLAPLVRSQIIAARSQNPGLGVPLHPLARELFQHVIGDDHACLLYTSRCV